MGAYNYRRVVVAGPTPLSDDPENSHAPVLLGGLELMEENGPWSPPEHARKVNFFGRLSDGNRDQGWSIESILYDAHWHSVDQVPLSLIQSGEISRYGAVDPTDGGNTGR